MESFAAYTKKISQSEDERACTSDVTCTAPARGHVPSRRRGQRCEESAGSHPTRRRGFVPSTLTRRSYRSLGNDVGFESILICDARQRLGSHAQVVGFCEGVVVVEG